jgi:putative flavoprotein involved in K+ transport
MSVEYEVAVIGGGQAGLTAGYYLSRAAVPFVILDAHERVGEAWRRRWDSLETFTNARYSRLPGLDVPGDQERFPGKDEIADYLETYARAFDLPIQLETHVASLKPAAAGYLLDTDKGSITATNAIVATGAYQRPHIPPLSRQLDPGVLQVHSAEYRNPSQLDQGRNAVVVGASNSGAQIALDLAATHSVALAQGTPLRRVPPRILGRSLHWWGDHLGLIGAPLDSWRGRTQRGDLLVGPSLRTLARRDGIRLVGRATAAAGRAMTFEGGSTVDADAVVWATGFRSDYSWIDAPVFDEGGVPVHRRGVTELAGLYFLGMPGQYSRGSSLISWVKDDAKFIVGHAVGRRTIQPLLD